MSKGKLIKLASMTEATNVKEVFPEADPLDRLPPEIWADRIFPLIPHLSRLRCHCVSSKWYRFLKSEEQAARAKPAPVWCLTIGVDVEDVLIELRPRRVEAGPLFCTVVSSSGGVLRLPQLTLPPDWRPLEHGGGFRAGGRLVAYLCDGHYRVGNPLHNMWEKVEAEVTDPELPFKRSSFALVVDERDGSYEIVAYKMNDQHPGHYSIWVPQPNLFPNDRDRNHDNWVIQVYSSKTRKWRDGPTLDHHVFKELSDVCVFERTVYFLGWEYVKRRTRPLRFPLLAGAPPVDPAILEREHREFKEDFRLTVWAYDLDSNALSEVVTPAQYYGGPGIHSTFNEKYQQDYRESIRLHVARQPRQVPSTSNTLEFSLVVVIKDWTATQWHSSGSFQDSLCRLVLNQEDPSLRYWEIEAMVRISELVAGGPRAALVADTWGVPFVAYDGYDLFRAETDQPWATTRVFCYDKDNQKWVDWYGYGPNELDQVAAVGFVACECCDGDLVSGGPFDEARVMPE